MTRIVLTFSTETYPPFSPDDDCTLDPVRDIWTEEFSSLRKAAERVTSVVGVCEANIYPVNDAGEVRWLTSTDTEDDYKTGEMTIHSVHFPDDMDRRIVAAIVRHCEPGGLS